MQVNTKVQPAILTSSAQFLDKAAGVEFTDGCIKDTTKFLKTSD